MARNYPFDLTIAANRIVFEYVKNLSAHSDVSELLVAAIKPLGDVQIYSPNNPNGYGYYSVSTAGIIIALAIGTRTIAFRLDNQMKERALATGGVVFPECGSNWVAFEPFRCDWPRVDFEFWARKAYVFARENPL